MSIDTNLDGIFRALANEKRRSILDLLKLGPKTTGELCLELAKLDRCTVMQHINVLEKANLIIVKRDGRVRWNVLNTVPIQEVYGRWIKNYEQNAAGFIASLKED